jgi:hypothetical protein
LIQQHRFSVSIHYRQVEEGQLTPNNSVGYRDADATALRSRKKVMIVIHTFGGFLVTTQGRAVNCGKRFFSMYRPSCLLKLTVRPEKYWLVWAGPLAKHLNNFNFIFLSDGLTAAAERAVCFADLDRH